MFEGMSDGVIAALIGGVLTFISVIVTALFPLLNGLIKSRMTARETETGAAAKSETGGTVLPGNQDASRDIKKSKKSGNLKNLKNLKSRTPFPSRLCLITLAAGLFLTVIFSLAFQHQARQNVKNMLYNSPDFYINMGAQDAETESDEINEIDNHAYQASLHAQESVIRIELNQYEKALREIEAAIELDPYLPSYRYQRYAILSYFNRHEEAAQELENAYYLLGLPVPEEART